MSRLRIAASLLALVLVAAAADTARAQIAIFHGFLRVSKPGKGTISRSTADGMLKVRKWTLLPTPDSNGIFPDREPVRLTFWTQPGVEQQFDIPAGMLVAKSAKVFSYRAPEPVPPQAIERFRIWLRKDGAWSLRFRVQGVHFDRLITEDPVCFPFAVIVGDDDGFAGIRVTSPSFESQRLYVPRDCPVDDSEWPGN